MNPEEYLTAGRVARLLGVTPQTVGDWARCGVLRGYRPGGRVWLFLWSEVQEDIARSHHTATPADETAARRPRTPSGAEQSPREWPHLRSVFRDGDSRGRATANKKSRPQRQLRAAQVRES